MPRKTLTPAQVAALGGFASARKQGHEGMAELGRKGGEATKEKHGTEHYVRAAHKRWGRLGGSPVKGGA